RQLFTFARARRLGFADDRVPPLLEAGATALLESEDEARGFPSKIDAAGRGTEFGAVLYDHAFVALAGAELDAVGVPGGSELSRRALERIDSQFRDGDGFHATAGTPGPRFANPHMHLLEASLLHHAVTESAGSQARIRQMADLATAHFIDADTGLLSERRAPDFGPSEDDWVEPGHCYEWAYLLDRAGETLDDDAVRRAARDLFERSEDFVETDGLVMDRVGAEPPTYRLWPQLERLRCLAAFGLTQEAETLLGTLDALYLSEGPEAGWVDKLDADRASLSDAVPASMLYHLLTAIPVLTRPDDRL
ncbi:MAG: AGE family epimerase/isomerase, partial [Litorimonas sp.]